MWKIYEEKEDGEAEHPPDGQVQDLHPRCGKRLHFG